MQTSWSLQLFTCLMLYASSVQAIMVKFGTRDGPIIPPTPTPEVPAPRPYRTPAPVWEAKQDDLPDPNAKWRPQLFAPNPRFTQVIFGAASTPPPQNSAQNFVNSYVPTTRPFFNPIQVQKPTNYLTPAQILSSQSLPGFGIRYFIPAYIEISKTNKQEDRKYNDVETNEIDGASAALTDSDFQWKYEKDAARRQPRRSAEGVADQQYQWPLYVFPRHQ